MTIDLGSNPGSGFRTWLGTASVKTIVLIAAALFMIFTLNLALSILFASWAHGADADSPRSLAPRFDTESNSAPTRVLSDRSARSTTIVTMGQCGHLPTARARQYCMVRASGGPWSYMPSATINGAMPTVVIRGESK
jgi:hypothetical protein